MTKKVIVSICSAVVFATAAIGAALAFTTAKGPYYGKVVEEGTNAPMSNVCVTDGRNVVKTDENGEFKLKGYRKTRFITVTTPSGYVAESYYIPVDKEKESYDFVLKKNEKWARRTTRSCRLQTVKSAKTVNCLG